MKCQITQRFAANANPLYKGDGLKGHTGIDKGCGWKSPVEALWGNEYVYKIFTPENPASDGFTGIFTIVETEDEVFEFLYGHVGDISVEEGQTLAKGQNIASEGAYGRLYQGGKACTDQESLEWGCGSHRHYQKRLIKLVASTLTSKNYLQHPDYGMYRLNDNYCEVIDFNNGYNGCVDFKLPDRDESEIGIKADMIALLLNQQAKHKEGSVLYIAFAFMINLWIKLLANLANKVK